MARYIKSFETAADIQTAVDNGDLLKPYVAFVTSGETLDFNTKVPPLPYDQQYFTIEAITSGYVVWFGTDTGVGRTISYSRDNGNTWDNISAGSVSSETKIEFNAGDVVIFKGNNTTYRYSRFAFEYKKQFVVYGNIMSLIYGDNFVGKTTFPSNDSNVFAQLFNENSSLVSAENLILPATALTRSCYYEMFKSNYALTSAPVLPATTLADSCYQSMFDGCVVLTTAPEILVTNNSGVFFAFNEMFSNCEKLTYVKCLINTPTNNCYSWLRNVPATGTFVKKAGVSWETGVSGIPSGWTVVEE